MLALVVLALAGPAQNPLERDLAAELASVRRAAGRPDAIAPLYRLADLDESVAVAAYGRALADAAAAITHPLVRAHAEWLLAGLDDRRGDARAAIERRARLGVLTRFWVAGPFDNEGRKGFSAVYPPEQEKAFDPARRYRGKEREVGWRRADPVVRQGLVPLEGLLRPDVNGVAYAMSFFELDQGGEVAVRLASSGAVKVWIDGAEVLAHDVYRPLRFDQDAGGVRLARGRHRLLVKIGVTEGGWSFVVRLTRADGGPLAFANAEPGPVASGRPRAVKVAQLAPLLRGRARAEYLAHVAPDDPDDRGAELGMRAVCDAEPSAECLRRLAELSAEANDRRDRLERALALAARAGQRDAEARAAAALGDAAAAARRDRTAEALWRRALAADPNFYPPALRLAEELADRGLLASGEELLSKVAARLPDVPRVVSAYARLLERRSKRAQAEQAFAPLYAALPADVALLRERYGFARGRGDVPGALAALTALAHARPESVTIAFDRAELLSGAGRFGDAEAALRLLAEQVPDEPRVWERLGRLLVRMGHPQDAVPLLRRALDLKPQTPEVRELLARIAPQPGADDLVQRFSRDPRKLAAAARTRKWPGEPSCVLLDLKVTRVHQNGLSQVFVQRVIEILDQRGAREEAEQTVRYTPETQSVEVRAARLIKASGEVIEAAARDDRDLSEPWYGLYYDLRGQVVRFDRLEPGDVIDFEYVLSDVGRRNLFADYFGDLHYFQEDTPRLESAYYLLAPASRPIYFNQPRLSGVTHSEKVSGSERIYEWRAHEVRKVELEPGMPGWSEVAAYLHVSTYKTWDEVAAWYWGLVRDQIAVDATMREAVARATSGLSSELDKVRAIHNLVVRQTRYVGLEFGIHGYQPYRTTLVFARKFGDCKDKASLLVALLKEIGVDATLVIVRTRRGGDLDEFPASLAIFDHAITYVPKYDLWLDGTAEYAGTGELPAPDQGVLVLLIERGHGRLVRTPVYPSQKNRVERREQLRVEQGGGARVSEHLAISGQAAPDWREHYQAPGERRERYEKAWNARQPGSHVLSVEMPAIEDLERPVEVRAQVELPRLSHPAGSAWAFPATGRESELARAYARLSARKHDLQLGYPWQQDERYEYELPAGWKPHKLPEPRKLETAFGRFEIQAEADGARVTVQAHLQVTRNRIARVDYSAFRRFLLDVDAAANQEVLVGP